MSVHQLSDGRWVCRHPKGYDKGDPQRVARYFGRGPEAQAEAIAYNTALGLGGAPQLRTDTRGGPLFVELVNAYLDARRHQLAKSSFDNLVIKMQSVILPLIGRYYAAHLTPSTLDEYVATRAEHVKLTTIHRELSDIRAVVRWAVSRRLLAANPLAGFSMPKRDDARIQPPTEAEFAAILACSVPHLQRAMLIAMNTGLRPGREELLGLTWDSVDFHGKTITVVSADKGGLPVRIVPLNSVLLEHLEIWEEADRKKGITYLIHYHGARIDSLKTSWLAAKKRARVRRRLRMYDIRHAFITTLLERGADLKSVSEIVGHASPDMTLRVYQHVSSELKRQAVSLLEPLVHVSEKTGGDPRKQ